MSPANRFGADRDSNFQVLWEDGDRVFCRTWRRDADGKRRVVLAVLATAEQPAPATLDRLAHEYGLKDELDGSWAVRPLEFVRDSGQTVLVLEDPGGEPLEWLLGAPLEVEEFLHLAIAIAGALAQVHRRGLVHKDVQPHNILVNPTTGEIRLTGFGIASRLPRERQAPEPPETITGTLAYMAPEQTGRMNRSIDSRSDLYALGVTFYQMLTGSLPFTASDPMEWVHCHIARKPIPPAERLTNVSATVSAIIMKLLAKTAEDRYQTASGLESDLRRCLTAWEARRRIEDFPLGQHDTPDRLLIPEKLYGRTREVETLLAAFNRVVNGGAPELVLVSGYSGIGKSSVVNELHKALVPSRGLFASGKFDQYKRNIPYATLAQAFRSLVRSLLSKSDVELNGWRDALLEALGANGQLMVDLVPELRLIIGDQPPVPELEPQQMQRRFQLVFRRFISVFARPEHPLALFLDDLQWLDAATLDLLEDVLTQPDLRHLLLIGAYRDNEVTASHPLRRKLDAIKSAGGKVSEITLAPLTRAHLGQLIADALRCEPGRAAPLVQLVHEKTGGNPFFAIQFLSSLAEEGMLIFDHDAARWSWDLERIHAKRYTDNVVELMVGKLSRLPGETQNALQLLACLGNTAETTKLSIILEISGERVHAALWPAVRQELLLRQGRFYKFTHDRVQEAAYSLVPLELRAEIHLRLGRQLVAHTPPEEREEAIFDIVDQLNRGAALIHEQDEREQLAEFNLLAGKRAKASTAYASALNYLTAGAALLADDAWERRRELIFALELHRAECEFLTGDLAAAETRLSMLSSRAGRLVDLAAITRLREELFTTLGQSDRAVDVCLDYLRHIGIAWSAHPTQEEAREEHARIWRQLGDRPIEALLNLPRMTDPVARATMEVLTAVMPATQFTDPNLRSLVMGRLVNLSLEHGNSDGSSFAYVWFGTMLGPEFGDYNAAFRFGKLAVDLVEKYGLDRFRARVYLFFGSIIIPWTRPIRTGFPLTRRAFETAQQAGDFNYAAYGRNILLTNLLAAGDPLRDVQREAEAGLDFVRQTRFGLVIDFITPQLQLIRMLRGLTPKFGCFDDAGFDEGQFERRLEADPSLAIAACWYWIRKVQARVFAGAYASSLEAASKAQPLLWMSPSFFLLAEYHFYAALARAALCDAASASERPCHLEVLAVHHRQLQKWAENCPENFEDRAALVGAEIARLEHRELDAERHYEQAIRSARENDFVHNEALANEFAARFYAARGFEKIAHVYLRDARYGYLRWGADGKVWQLDQLHPYLREKEQQPASTSMIGAPVEQLDLATVIKVSQTVSGEMVLEKLLDTLLRTAIEHAGAARGLLIIVRGAEPRIVAEARIDGGMVIVQLLDEPVTAAMLPEAVLHYVLHTRESVILDDAAAQEPFAADPYIRQHQGRSVLALPLLTQAKLVGMLYLENNLAPRVFAPARIAVLKLLASQAAIALENTHLYREVAEREAKIRRLVDANIIGIFIYALEGRIIEANDAFLRMVGYDRADLASGGLRWQDLTPPEWLERDERQWVPMLHTTGILQPYEKEYFRKDGNRVSVLLGAASFDETGKQGVAFVLDLTERKLAEEAARTMQMELAHANRVATMGQLTSSIAHEVYQPVAAVVASAGAALHWLDAEPPALEEVRRSLDRIVKDGHRTRDVIDKIRTLIKKAPPRKDHLDINEAIREVIELIRVEAVKNSVSADTDLMDGLPLIEGDRVQLQQVILNLLINAVQAMSGMSEGKRELLISTARADPNCVLVTVQDSGPGLAPEVLERLFEPFYTTKPGGLGLGLSICRSIIEAHGGRLWVSENVPRGAIFHFTMPACPDGEL